MPSSFTAASCRLFGIVARAARVAVVFRRGPSKQVRMLRWNLATDEVMGGQWLSGRIYEHRSGVSPDGQLVVYFAGKFKGPLGTFTAVSRPPYFTALAVWPEGSTWGGGGFFESDRHLVLNYQHVLKELNDSTTVPRDFVVSHLGDYRERFRSRTLAEHHDWRLVSPRLSEKPNPVRPHLSLERSVACTEEPNGPLIAYGFQVRDRRAHTTEDLGRLDWADWDHDGSLLSAGEGCLRRRRLGGEPKCVADLREHVFTNLPPPASATEWPS